MKKVLVVFLVLAVAGGLFAQSITTNVQVQTGLGVGFSDATDGTGDPKIDYIRDRGDTGMRAEATFAFTSADDAAYGKFGASVRIRGSATKFVNDGWALSIPIATLWWTPSSILRLDIGTNDPGGFGSLGGIDASNDVRNGDAGLKALLSPIPGLDLGAHLVYGRSLLLLEDVSFRAGVKYAVPSLLTAVANFRYNNDAGTKAANSDKAEFNFAAGASFIGIPGLTIAADLAGYKFGNDNLNFIGIGERIGYTAGPLSLVARAQQFIGTGDSVKDSDFMPMLFRGEVNYTVSSVVSAGIEGVYQLGAAPTMNYRHAVEGVGVASAGNFVKDNKAAGLTISPRVTFNVGPQIILGYNLRMNTTDGFTASADNPKQQNLVYGIVNINF
jgi:hypothetical protein